MLVEYTITRASGYAVEVDGTEIPAVFETADKAANWCKAHAKDGRYEGAGITEAWHNGRQWVRGPRGGWRRCREAV